MQNFPKDKVKQFKIEGREDVRGKRDTQRGEGFKII